MNKRVYSYSFTVYAISRLLLTVVINRGNILFGIYCFITAIMYFILSYLVSRDKYPKLVFNLFFTELLIFGISGVIIYGNGCGFIMMVLALIPVTSYVLYSSEYFSNSKVYLYDMLNAFIAIMMPVIGLYHKPIIEISDMLRKYVYISNTLSSVVLITLFDIMFTIKNKQKFNELEEHNIELETEANYDPLTHKLNRRSFNQKFNEQVVRCKANYLRMYVIMLDIDHFKKFNDTYGHDFGDIVLIGVSDILQSQLRKSDNLFRWGGEEFLIILSCQDHDLNTVMERLLNNVRTHVFENNGQKVSVTISAGLAIYDNNESVDRTIEKADVALYYSKEHGRDRVTYYNKRME